MSFKCEFCDKGYSSKNNLTLHQKTAKFCLEIQNQNKSVVSDSEEKVSIESYLCDFCKKTFTQKKSLVKHETICKEKIKKDVISKYEKEEITNLKNQIQQLTTDKVIILNDLKNEKKNFDTMLKNERSLVEQLKIERDNLLKQLVELKLTPTVNNNTTNNNNFTTQTSTKVSNVTNNSINNKLQLTEDFLAKLRNSISFKEQVFLDEEDICRWSLKNGLNYYFAVLDKSRKVLTFVDEKGNKIRDQDGVMLANKLYKEFCETIKRENAQEYLNGLKEDPDEMYVPTTLMRRKKLVQNVIAGNEYSVQRLGSSIFKEYPRYEPKTIEQESKTTTTIEDKTQQQKSKNMANDPDALSHNFSMVKSKIKNLFYKYNFDPLNYGLHTIGSFLMQFLEELEIRATDKNEWVEIKDDEDNYVRLDDKQFFEFMTDIFTEEDLVQIMLKCKTEEYTKNLIVFQKVFIMRQFNDVERIIENLFLGIRGAF